MNDEKLTATERLRQLLDERGVEWDYGITGPSATRFNANGVDVTFTPILDGLVCSTILTPEQAIAVTLGRGTCRAKTTYCDMWKCDECGEVWWQSAAPSYCPSCGREVER